MADLDGSKSALMAKEATQMNSAGFGSLRDVGVEICDPQAAKIKQGQFTHKKIAYLSFQMADLDGTKVLSWPRRRCKLIWLV